MCIKANVLKEAKEMMEKVKGVERVDIITPIMIDFTTNIIAGPEKDIENIYEMERTIMMRFPGIVFDFHVRKVVNTQK